MLEATNENVEPRQDINPNEPGNSAPEEVDQTAQASAQETEQAGHFRKLREARERAERERDEALKMIRQMEERQREATQPEPEEDMGFGSDEELAEIRHLKKIAKRQKELEKELSEYKKQATHMTAEARLKATYKDLDKVLTDENISELSKTDPDLMASIQYNPDTYSKYSAAYKAIKRLGIYKEDKYEKERAKAQENIKKPRPLSSVSPQQGDSPLSKANAFANGLTQELKDSLVKEMQEARRKY